MNRKIKCYKAVICIVLFYAVILGCLLGPVGILEKDRIVAGTEVLAGETLDIHADNRLQQVFIADGGYLRYLDIYVTSPEAAGKFFRLMVYDETNEILINKEVLLDNTDVYPGYMRLPVGIETVAGRAYVWQLQGTSGNVSGPIRLGWQNTGETGVTNLGYYYVVEGDNITTYEAQNVLMRQVYTQSPSGIKMAALFGVLILGSLLLCGVFAYLGQYKKLLNKQVRVQQLLWTTVAPVYYTAAAFVLYEAVVVQRFGHKTEDKGTYIIGIGIVTLFVTAVLFLPRRQKKELPVGELLNAQGMNWLQAGAFAGILWSCIRYMNAQYQIYQDCAYREVLVWIGFLFLTMGKGRKLFDRLHTQWLIAGGMLIFAVLQGKLTVGADMLLLYHVCIGVLAVLAGGMLVCRVRTRAFGGLRFHKGYLLLMGVLFLLLAGFRNTRGWPLYLVIVFVLFYLFYLSWENREALLANFCSGVTLNFALAVLFAIARRPFRAWMFARYNFVFHTVTVTATYLTLVICVLLVRLFVKLKAGRGFGEIWGTLLLYGMAVSYLFFTFSRTGYLATVAAVLLLIPFMSFLVYRESVGRFLGKIVLLALTVLLSMPVAYCSVRLVPVYYNDPYIYELENTAAAVLPDDPGDSTKYMSVSYFKHVMRMKLFGIEASLTEDMRKFLLCLEDGIYVRSDDALVVSAGEAQLDGAPDVSNGRFDIFAEYIRNWNLTGHKDMAMTMPDGDVAMHAHNTYLQVIHDHGLFTGLLFILFGAVSGIRMLVYAVKKNKKDPYSVLPVAVFIGFAVAGLVEWLFHPCNPFGFSVMVMFAPLLYHIDNKENKNASK